jgi:superfamily II DNA/RNA helicase
MRLKNAIIEVMNRDDLKQVVEDFELEGVDKRRRDEMAALVSRKGRAKAELLLEYLNEAQVKDVCELIGVSSKGRRTALIERIIDTLSHKQSGQKVNKTAVGQFSNSVDKKKEQKMSSQQPARTRKMSKSDILAPGARIEVRDAEWLVRRVDRTHTGGQAIRVVGISELVRDKETIFLTEIEPSIEILDPVDTHIVPDNSSSYQASLLYMESLLRQTPPTDENLYIGHKAAMDLVPYQMDPAIQALAQPRQRILMADAVGLGKTLECGVLLSELIRRGKGKRILVLAVKSMLTQFQKELWSRFSIPLTRLDSIGIQRVRHRIPTNQNPFFYYDKTIISIDTLKQDTEYRTYLENAYWDIIVIDEAQNVAVRGKSQSLRSRLAELLSSRSDTLIMLSATPHDGKARSFASLMNMLDPTAIANPEDYGPEDIKGLFIRRFKKDIQHQVQKAFQERKISIARCKSTAIEEDAFETFVNTKFVRLDQKRGASQLFKTTLEKALFSSPQACLQTIQNRIKTLEKKEDSSYQPDIDALENLAAQVDRIEPSHFAKYQKLVEIIKDKGKGLGWSGKDRNDRLVIFTERIKTMEFLKEHLSKDLGLKEEQVSTLHGIGMSDVEQQKVVEDFGKDEAPVRLLIASDVASEGINLHYLSHKMIHFDIPWSLMVFKQRNGRIDRYGQESKPLIVYLVTESQHQKIRGDMRILELLIDKDDQAVTNIGDPSTWMGVYDIDTEELITSKAIEDGFTAEEFNQQLEEKKFDPLEALLGNAAQPIGEDANKKTKPVHTLFEDDYSYLEAAIKQIQENEWMQVEFYPDEKKIELTAADGGELDNRFRFLPPETWPEKGAFILSADKATIQEEIRRSRKDEKAWPNIQYLWPLNPVLEWANDKVLAAFGRHEAPLITMPKGCLQDGEVVFVVSGLIPNRKSHPLVHTWFGVSLKNNKFAGIEEFSLLQERTGLGNTKLANKGDSEKDAASYQEMLPEVVKHARKYMSEQRNAFENQINPKLDIHYKALETLKKKQVTQLDVRYQRSRLAAKTLQERKDSELRRIEKIFDRYLEWIQETMTTEDNPYIQVIAVLRGAK